MGELEQYFKDIKEEISVFANEAAKDTCLAMVSYVAFNTPADTTKLLSNWVVNFNSPPPDGSDIEAHFVGKDGKTRTGSANETINRARFDLSLKKPGDTIYLSNVTPYIGYVNNGTEKIAAANFVEAMIIVGRNHDPVNGPIISSL